jgi:hypothetical protein
MSEFFQSLDRKTNWFFHSYLFLIILGICYFLSWFYSSLDGLCLTTSIGFLLVVFFSLDGRCLAPFFVFPMIAFHELPYFNSIPSALWGVLGSVGLGLLLMLLKKAVLVRDTAFSLSSAGFSLILFVGVAFLSSLVNQFRPDNTYLGYGYLADGFFAFYALLFFLLTGFSKRGVKDFLLKEMYVFNLLVLGECLAMFVSGSRGADLFNLGWSNKNTGSVFLECLLPFAAEIFAWKMKRIDALALASVDFALIAASDCRGALGTIILLIPLLAYLVIHVKSKHPLHDTLVFTGLAVAVSLICYYTIPALKSGLDYAMEMGGDLTGREDIWSQSLSYFSQSPFVGTGTEGLFQLYHWFDIYQWGGDGSSIGILFCHDTWITLLAGFGVLGVLAYLIHNAEVMYSVFRAKAPHRFAVLYMVAASLIHGLVENTFFALVFMLPYLIVIADPDLPPLLPDLISLIKTKKRSVKAK